MLNIWYSRNFLLLITASNACTSLIPVRIIIIIQVQHVQNVSLKENGLYDFDIYICCHSMYYVDFVYVNLTLSIAKDKFELASNHVKFRKTRDIKAIYFLYRQQFVVIFIYTDYQSIDHKNSRLPQFRLDDLQHNILSNFWREETYYRNFAIYLRRFTVKYIDRTISILSYIYIKWRHEEVLI